MKAYDRQGRRISIMDSQRLRDDDEYRQLGDSEVRDGAALVRISTVWLGFDSNAFGPPLIFETMVFGGRLDGHLWRYPTECEAKAGHERVVNLIRSMVAP